MARETEEHFQRRLKTWRDERRFQEYRFFRFFCSGYFDNAWMNAKLIRREYDAGIEPLNMAIGRIFTYLTYPFGVLFFAATYSTILSLDFKNYAVALLTLPISLPHLWYTKFLIGGTTTKPRRGQL